MKNQNTNQDQKQKKQTAFSKTLSTITEYVSKTLSNNGLQARFDKVFNRNKKQPVLESQNITQSVKFSAKDSQPRTRSEWRADWLNWGYNEKLLYEGYNVLPNNSVLTDDYPQYISDTISSNPIINRVVESMTAFLSSEELQIESGNQEAKDYINKIFTDELRLKLAKDAFVFKGISAKTTLEIEGTEIKRKVQFIPFKQTRRNSPYLNENIANEFQVPQYQNYGEKPSLIFHAPDFRLFDTNGRLVYANQFKVANTNRGLLYGSAYVADEKFKNLMNAKVYKPYAPLKINNINAESILNMNFTTTMYWDFIDEDPYYPTSPIESVLEWAATQNKINEYFNYLIDNQITAGFIMLVPTKPGMDIEEKQAAADEIYQDHSGKRAAGKPILHFYESATLDRETNKPEIIEVKRGQEVDKTYLEAEQRGTERIITGLGAYPHLVGLQTASGFSDKAEEMDGEFKFMEFLSLSLPKKVLLKLYNSILKEKFPNENVVIVTKLPLSQGTQLTKTVSDNIKSE